MTPRELRLHLMAAGGGSPADTHALIEMLQRRCWPAAAETDGGAARAWLVRWHPRPGGVLPPACACATGRCAVCN